MLRFLEKSQSLLVILPFLLVDAVVEQVLVCPCLGPQLAPIAMFVRVERRLGDRPLFEIRAELFIRYAQIRSR